MSQEASREGNEANATSVLKIINQKEAELRHQVAEAQHRASALIQAAREEAEQMLVQADQEARAEAEQRYQHELEEANQKAEALLITARDQAVELRHLAQARLDEAAWRLVSLTLPEGYPVAEKFLLHDCWDHNNLLEKYHKTYYHYHYHHPHSLIQQL